MRLARGLICWSALVGVLGCSWDLVVSVGDAGLRNDGGLADGGSGGGGGGSAGGGGGGAAVTDGGGGSGGGDPGKIDGGPGFTDAGCVAATSCYSGLQGTENVGVCRGGVQLCRQEKLTACLGEVLPSVESCNGIDDDCNGQVDDTTLLGTVSCGLGACKTTVPACSNRRPVACTPTPPGVESCANSTDDDCDGVVNNGCDCVYVAQSGSDTAGNGSMGSPYATISTAIALAGSNGLGKQVCVASADPGCSSAAGSVATYTEPIVMRDGISVFGGYRNPADGGTWTRPPAQTALHPNGTVSRKGCVTMINATNERGVLFTHQIANVTSIDGFTINAFTNPDGGGSAAVSIVGSLGAQLNDNLILGAGAQPTGTSATPFTQRLTVGVAVDGKADPSTPLLSNNAIIGGMGAVSMGVVSLGGSPRIQDSCTNFDPSGRCVDRGCDSSCAAFSGAARRFILARPLAVAGNCTPAALPTTPVESYAVRLESSPGATVSRSTLCTSPVPGDSAALRMGGNSAGVLVRANHLDAEGTAQGATNAVGIWMESCKSSPWIVNNSVISGSARTPGARGDGIRVVGDCSARINNNQLITGGVEQGLHQSHGIHCARDPLTRLSSRCTISNNVDIVGAAGGFPPISAGVRCDEGACARIDGNARISSRSGARAFGIMLGDTNTWVSRNSIEAGCASNLGVGVLSANSSARIENNAIGGSRWTGSTTCMPGAPAAQNVYGILAILAEGPNEVQVINNHVFAFGAQTQCLARAISFDVAEPCTTTPCLLPPINPPLSPRGVIRNNIFHAGFAGGAPNCAGTYVVEEAHTAADPRVFEHNNLWLGTNTSPTTFYKNEASAKLASVAEVNALTDITVKGNLSVDPGFVTGFNFPSTPITAPGTVPTVELRLSASSPLVDAGTPTGAFFDFYLTPRPRGGAWDIGAHEQ